MSPATEHQAATGRALGFALQMMVRKPPPAPRVEAPERHRFSFAEIATAVGINENTVRSHFTSFSDVFPAEKTVGPRGKRAYSQRTFDIYKMFLVLKGDEIRLNSTQAIDLLRKGHYDTLRASIDRNISSLLITVQRLRAGTANPADLS